MRIGVIGCGVVGEATARVLEDRGHMVARHDPLKELFFEEPIDIAFICTPTPLEGGELNMDAVASGLETAIMHRARTYVMRSTLSLAAEAGNDVVYMPCFAREDFAYADESNPQFRVFGGEMGRCQQVADLFNPTDDAIFVDFRTAEFIKLAINAKLATDISFATEMSRAAGELGVDWGEVAYALKLDKRIGTDAYLRPGPFGGKCLPKDTTNLATQTNSTLLRAVLEVNERAHDKSKSKEYIHVARR